MSVALHCQLDRRGDSDTPDRRDQRPGETDQVQLQGDDGRRRPEGPETTFDQGHGHEGLARGQGTLKHGL